MSMIGARYIDSMPQRTRDVIISSLLRESDVGRSFWRDNDVIIASCAHWNSIASISCYLPLILHSRISEEILFNTLRPRQHGRHFADDIHFLLWKWLNKFSLKDIPKIIDCMVKINTTNFLAKFYIVGEISKRKQNVFSLWFLCHVLEKNDFFLSLLTTNTAVTNKSKDSTVLKIPNFRKSG